MTNTSHLATPLRRDVTDGRYSILTPSRFHRAIAVLSSEGPRFLTLIQMALPTTYLLLEPGVRITSSTCSHPAEELLTTSAVFSSHEESPWRTRAQLIHLSSYEERPIARGAPVGTTMPSSVPSFEGDSYGRVRSSFLDPHRALQRTALMTPYGSYTDSYWLFVSYSPMTLLVLKDSIRASRHFRDESYDFPIGCIGQTG